MGSYIFIRINYSIFYVAQVLPTFSKGTHP